MRAVNVRVTSKHPFLSQSDRIGDKRSISTRSLLIRRGLFVSEQDTDTVSTSLFLEGKEMLFLLGN